MHIVIALRRRVRLFRLGAREGFEKKAPGAGRRSRIAQRVRIFLHIALAQRRRVRFFGSERAKVAPSEGRFGGPLIECGEYDRLEFYGTDQLERGPRFEAPFQKCVRLTRFKFCQSATDRHRGSEFWHGWPKGSTFSCLFPTRRRL